MNATAGNRAVASLLSSRSAQSPVVQRVFEHEGQRYDEEAMPVHALRGIVTALRNRLNIEQAAYDRAFLFGGDDEDPVELRRLVGWLEAKLKERLREVAKPELAGKVEPPGKKGDKHFGRVLEEAQRSDLIAILSKWELRAGELHEEVTKMLKPMLLDRKSMGDPYYENEGATFRAEYKKLKRQATHLKWAKSLASEFSQTLEDGEVPLEAFRVVGTGSEVQAVLQLRHEEGSGDDDSPGAVDPSYIEVIVGNPDNIVGGGGGVMKPLIAVAILASQGSPIRLTAATNKVKGIYDHYGFRVVASSPERLVERPERHVKAPSVDYYAPEVLGPLVPRKTTWHRTDSMVLTPEAAEQFLAKYPLKEVLDAESIESLTSKLKPALQEGTDENVTVDLTVGERS